MDAFRRHGAGRRAAANLGHFRKSIYINIPGALSSGS